MYDLDTMTRQEVFDAACNHLLTQNQKSMVGFDATNSGCAYRGEGGLKCAAGIFIPDDKYTSWMEGKDWAMLQEYNKVSLAHTGLIIQLQRIHDRVVCDRWRDSLIELAQSFNLTLPAIITNDEDCINEV